MLSMRKMSTSLDHEVHCVSGRHRRRTGILLHEACKTVDGNDEVVLGYFFHVKIKYAPLMIQSEVCYLVT